MPQSSTTQSFVDQLRAEGLARGLSPNEVEMRLAQAGYVPMPQGGAGGGYGMLANLGRQIGAVGERGAVEGLGNLVGLPFSMAGAAYQAATGNAPPQMLQPQGTAVANQLGLPQPQTGGERIAKEAVSGAAASLPFAAAGAVPPVAGAMLGAGAGAAGQGAAEAGAGPLGQAAASMAVGLGIPVAATVGAAAIRSAIAGTAARRQAAEQSRLLLQAGDPNAAVTLGQVAEGGLARTVEGGLRNVPGASRTFKQTLEGQADEMGERVTRIADQISPSGSPTEAGRIVQRGIERGFIPRFRATQARLEQAVWGSVPESTLQYPGRTVKLFQEQGNVMAQARPFSENLVTPQMQGWADDLAKALEKSPDGIPIGVLRSFRSRIGLMLDDAAIPGVDRADLHRLYGALSDDVGEAITRVGGAPAAKAWTRAQNYWRAGRERLDNILQPLLDKKTPEVAFNAVLSGTRDGATVLRSTMRSLAPEQRRVVASSVLRRLGNAPPGAQGAAGDAFSPETFLTSWNKLSPEAKGALFEGIDPLITKDLNRLAKAIDLRKQASAVLPNPSGTAANTAFMSLVNALGGGLIGATFGQAGKSAMVTGGGTLLGIGGGKLAAKAFTNPNMIRWLVKQTKVPFGALSQELAILARDSQKWDDPEGQEIAREMVDTFGNMDWSQILLASAVADAARVQ